MSDGELLRDAHGEMSLYQYIDAGIKYLEVLQDGRIKPNTRAGHGSTESTVRDSWENMGEITAVKKKLNQLLELNLEIISRINDEQENKRNKDYR